MRAEQLRDAVSGIGMTEDMRTAVIRNVKERTEESKTGNGQRKKTGETERMLQDGKARSSKRSKNHGTVWRKNLAVAAAVLVAIGIVAGPGRALVNFLGREGVGGRPGTGHRAECPSPRRRKEKKKSQKRQRMGAARAWFTAAKWILFSSLAGR